MPRVSTFLYCEGTVKEEAQDGLIIRNPLMIFRPAFVPGMFSFSIFFGISGINDGNEHLLRIKFINIKDIANPIIDTGDLPIRQPQYEPGHSDNEIPTEFQGMMANLDFRNAVLRNEGEYYTEIHLDNILLDKFPIYVKGAE